MVGRRLVAAHRLDRQRLLGVQAVEQRRIVEHQVGLAAVQPIDVGDGDPLVVLGRELESARLEPQVDVLRDQDHPAVGLPRLEVERRGEDPVVVAGPRAHQMRVLGVGVARR